MEMLYYRVVDYQCCNKEELAAKLMEVCEKDLNGNCNYNNLIESLLNGSIYGDPALISKMLDDILKIVKSTYATNISEYITSLGHK